MSGAIGSLVEVSVTLLDPLETLELEEFVGVKRWKFPELNKEEEELDELEVLDSSSPDSSLIKLSGGDSGLGIWFGLGSRRPARK